MKVKCSILGTLVVFLVLFFFAAGWCASTRANSPSSPASLNGSSNQAAGVVVNQTNTQTVVEVRQFPNPVLQRLVLELGLLKHLDIRLELDARTGFVRARLDLERLDDIAAGEQHRVLTAFAVNFHLEPFAYRIDHADADPVKAARYLV